MVGIQKQKSPEQARVTSHASYAGVGLVRLVRPLSRRSDSEAAPVVIGFVRLVRLNFVSTAPLIRGAAHVAREEGPSPSGARERFATGPCGRKVRCRPRQVFKLIIAASKTWRRPKVIGSVSFHDGPEVIEAPSNHAA